MSKTKPVEPLEERVARLTEELQTRVSWGDSPKHVAEALVDLAREEGKLQGKIPWEGATVDDVPHTLMKAKQALHRGVEYLSKMHKP